MPPNIKEQFPMEKHVHPCKFYKRQYWIKYLNDLVRKISLAENVPYKFFFPTRNLCRRPRQEYIYRIDLILRICGMYHLFSWILKPEKLPWGEKASDPSIKPKTTLMQEHIIRHHHHYYIHRYLYSCAMSKVQICTDRQNTAENDTLSDIKWWHTNTCNIKLSEGLEGMKTEEIPSRVHRQANSQTKTT